MGGHIPLVPLDQPVERKLFTGAGATVDVRTTGGQDKTRRE